MSSLPLNDSLRYKLLGGFGAPAATPAFGAPAAPAFGGGNSLFGSPAVGGSSFSFGGKVYKSGS